MRISITLIGLNERPDCYTLHIRTNENNPDYSALFRFRDVLNNEPDETFPAEIEKVLDVEHGVMRFAPID